MDIENYVPAAEYDSIMNLYVSTLKELTAANEELKLVKKENTRLNRIERRQQRRFKQADSAGKKLGGIE